MLWIFCAFVLYVNATTKLPYTIPGPKSYNDKIAIVGAGSAGVHMAYLLKKAGFKNVKIFEETSRIGGKCHTVSYRGANHDLGAVFLAPNYEKNVIELVKKYVPNDLYPTPSYSSWINLRRNQPLTFVQYVVGFGLQFLNTTNSTFVRIKFIEAILKYNALHEQLFGKYDGEIMPEPTPEVSLHKP